MIEKIEDEVNFMLVKDALRVAIIKIDHLVDAVNNLEQRLNLWTEILSKNFFDVQASVKELEEYNKEDE
jgi:hypothetical protein